MSTDPTSWNGPGAEGLQGIGRVGAGGNSTPAESAASAPEFRALLDDLVGRARELDQATRSVEQPEQLAGAVETARTSLEDALSLGQHLIDAYREALQRESEGS